MGVSCHGARDQSIRELSMHECSLGLRGSCSRVYSIGYLEERLLYITLLYFHTLLPSSRNVLYILFVYNVPFVIVIGAP